MFRILRNKFVNLEYAEKAEKITYGDIIKYYDTELTKQGVLHVIPLQYRDDFQVSLMKISGAVPPHTDSEIITSINFYLKPGKYRTTFYTPEPKAVKRQIENQTTGYIFEQHELANRGSFVANPGDAYVLNVSEVHGVEPLGELEERVVICLATDKHDFEAVLSMLYRTGHI
jgi:hypothetical protein